MLENKLAIAWNGLPAYGSVLLQNARKSLGKDFPIIATRAKVPNSLAEKLHPENLHWIPDGVPTSWTDLSLQPPSLFIHTGWRFPHFIALADEVRTNGGNVIGMFDNNWKGSIRQRIGSLYFRLFLRKKYAATWVPGASATRLAYRIGFAKNEIHTGMYGSDPKIFFPTVPLRERAKTILFVGQLIERKNVHILADAFERFHTRNSDWKLQIIGCGPLENYLKNRAGISVKAFAPPSTIANAMNNARILALPSREEHWGLVVHEAVLCGCGLLLSKEVGASHDLANNQNSILIKKTNTNNLLEAMNRIAELESSNLDTMEEASLKLSRNFGPEKWARTLNMIIQRSDVKYQT